MNKVIFVLLAIATVVVQIVLGDNVSVAIMSGFWCLGGGLLWEMVRNIK